MKPPPLILTLLLALESQASDPITADMVVSQGGDELGTITIEFDHEAAPMATANFIGLASGKLSWIDSTTGVVQHNKPYYDGLTFHRVIDGFMNQGGSQNGLGNDSPGYTFQDGAEVTNGLDHSLSYRISMANSGLNSNGSQFFLTVGTPTWLDGKHIVFGQIKDTGPSRSVVDAINNVDVIDADGPDNDINTSADNDNRPVDPVIIDSVTVDYHGINFDPSAQGLPIVSSPTLAAPITPATTTLEFIQPAGSTFHLAYSDDLTNWSRSSPRTLDINDTPFSSFPMPGAATGGPRQFFSPALVTYNPDTYMPASLANQTLTVDFNEATPMVFVFDATGETASWSHLELSGTATFYASYSYNHFQAFLGLDLPTHPERYWQLNSMRLTGGSPTEISGTHSLSLFDSSTNFIRSEPDTFTLTK